MMAQALLAAAVVLAAMGPAAATVDWRPAEEPIAPSLAVGDEGEWALRLNARLEGLGFRPDEGDEFGYRTRHAVIAFEKHHGLPRTGVFRPGYWPLLDEAPRLAWRSEADRVEIDLGKQVLYLIEDNDVTAVVPVSSGNGEMFVGRSGDLVPARTPEGTFAFDRKIEGMRRSYLGELYNPFYFRGGYAVHGSPSVPAYPASHGCVRVTFGDMDFLKERLAIGMTVYVYGQRTVAPEAPVARLLPEAPRSS